MSNFPSLLKEARAAAGLTQSEVASKANLTAAHISHFETGERLPCLENLKALCLALNVSANHLLEVPDPEKAAFTARVGAPSFTEATEVLLRTKRQDEEKMEEMHDKIKELGAWKESALQVMPDMQKNGELLGVRLGDTVHDKIVPGIEALNAQIESLTQSPAPSKEMEERIRPLATRWALDATFMLTNPEGTVGSFMQFGFDLAAELGKERDALENDTLGYINEIATLKRELSEAREETAYHRKSTKSHEETIGRCHDEMKDLRAQLLALSASCQRQKEALERLYNYQAQRSSPDTAWDEPMMRNARAALAETPDVSLLELPSEVASEREPEAPEARAFNTSEGLINIKEKLERHFAARFDCKCSPEKHCVCIENFEASLIALAADLGKEREAERSGGRVNSSAFWCDNRHVVDYEEAFNIERDLLAQNAQLKHELAEAREQMDTFINQWSETNNSMQRENLALSSAYQRQKEALSEIGAICRASQDNPGDEDVDWFAEIENRTHAALAETPDVSLWQPIDSAPKDGTRILALWPYSKTQCWFETFWDDDESQGDKPGWYAPEWGCLLDGYNPTHWQPLPPPLTLQPDHQK